MWIELGKYYISQEKNKPKGSADINFYVYSELQDFEIQNVERFDQIVTDDMLYLNDVKK
jgi:hypothetical protein